MHLRFFLLVVATTIAACCNTASATLDQTKLSATSENDAHAIGASPGIRSLRGTEKAEDDVNDEERGVTDILKAGKDKQAYKKWAKEGKTAEDIYKAKGLETHARWAYATRDYKMLQDLPKYQQYMGYVEYLNRRANKKIAKASTST
jgi:hypothetical protein